MIPPVKASTTEKPSNRVIIPIYLRVSPEGALIPIERRKRKAAHYTCNITVEYPLYELELKLKQDSLVYYETHHYQQLDYDKITEARIRHCLAKWDLEETVPPLNTKRLHRIQGVLEDDSMILWKKLPPLLRKSIAIAVNDTLGPP